MNNSIKFFNPTDNLKLNNKDMTYIHKQLSGEIEIIENKILEDIKKYQIEYDINNITNTKEQQIELSTNINNVTEQEINSHLLKNMTLNEKKSILLRKILNNNKMLKKNVIPSDNISMKQYIKICKNILNVYKGKKITNVIEDDTWILHNSESKKYPLNKDEILFENTVSLAYISDNLLIEYLENLIIYINNMVQNFKAKFKIIESRNDGVGFVVILCKKNNK